MKRTFNVSVLSSVLSLGTGRRGKRRNGTGKGAGSQFRTSTAWCAALLIALALPLSACGDTRAQGGDLWAEGRESGAPAAEVPVADVRPERDQAELARKVRTVHAKKGTLTVSRSASVTIEPAQESYVSAGTTGQVEQILAREGSRVEAGQTVLQLNDESLRLERDNAQLALEIARVNLRSARYASDATAQQAEVSLQPAETNLAAARRSFEEGQQLFEAGGVSKTQLGGLQLRLEQAESASVEAQEALAKSQRTPAEELELLRLQVEQAETQLLQAEWGLEQARLSAPFAGEIAEVLVEEGEFAVTGNPAFRLVGDGPQLARFSIPPEDAAALAAQKTIWIRYGGRDYAARIMRFSGSSDQTRLVGAVAELYESKTRIPTGTVTEFSYNLELSSGVLLPAGVVRRSGAGRATALVVKNGRVAEHLLQLRAESGAQVVVAGIGTGAAVIYPVPDDLGPGTPVEIVGGS